MLEKNGDITASNATLEMYLPKLVILIRDFFLELRDRNGQEVFTHSYYAYYIENYFALLFERLLIKLS